MCNFPRSIHRRELSAWDSFLGYKSSREMIVPCGKCFDCLRKRQNDITIRAYREACKYSKAYFLTFTYNNDVVPLAQSLWSVSTDTGEELCVAKPELLEDDLLVSSARQALKSSLFFGQPFIFESEIATPTDLGFKLFTRITPTLNVRDLRLCIKSWRVWFERLTGHKLEFSYILVGEYGNHKSRRPHYHMLLMSNMVEDSDIARLCGLWHERFQDSFTYVKKVQRINPDKSDGFFLACKYVGKYVCKGQLEQSAVKDGLTLKYRFCASRGFGSHLAENVIAWYQCQDIVKYDPLKAYDLPRDVKDKLVPCIVERLRYNLNGRFYSLPLALKKRIFGFSYSKDTGKTCWFPIYYMVTDFIRGRAQAKDDREFFTFVFQREGKSLREAVIEFYDGKKAIALDREISCKKNLISVYQKSKI